jgi:hypothetical protein
MKAKWMIGNIIGILAVLMLVGLVLTADLPGRAQEALPVAKPLTNDGVNTEVSVLLTQVDTVVVPTLTAELSKEQSLGVNTQGAVIVLQHIKQASEFMKSHAPTPFALYVMASNVNAAWYNLLLDAYKFQTPNPQEAQELIMAHTAIKPIADLASALAYRSIRNQVVCSVKP